MDASAYLGLGSNIERRRNLRAALDLLQARFGALAVSPVYQCAAVGFSGPAFYNLVVGVETRLSPGALDEALKAIEQALGRDRSGPRFSNRPIDIDLLLHGDKVGCYDGLELPRDEIDRYPFVLKPLSDLIPEGRHPRTGMTYSRAWGAMARSGHDLERVDLGWPSAHPPGESDAKG